MHRMCFPNFRTTEAKIGNELSMEYATDGILDGEVSRSDVAPVFGHNLTY